MDSAFFLEALTHWPRNCFGYDTRSEDMIFDTYLAVLFTIDDTTFGMLQLQQCFQTVSFLILSSLTSFYLSYSNDA